METKRLKKQTSMITHILPKVSPIVNELHTELKQFYGSRLAHVILFGSQARGDSVAGSDIDVLVVLKGEVDPVEEIEATGEIISDLSLQHDEVLSCVFVDEQRYALQQDGLMRNVAMEGISI